MSVPDYDTVPDSIDLIDDLEKFIRNNYLKENQKKILSLKEQLDIPEWQTLVDTYSAVQNEICSVLVCINYFKQAIEVAYVKDQKEQELENGYF